MARILSSAALIAALFCLFWCPDSYASQDFPGAMRPTEKLCGKPFPMSVVNIVCAGRDCPSPPELQRLKLEAVKGSSEAAEKLSVYYGTVVQDYDQDLHWLTIAAEDGSVRAMQNLGVELRAYREAGCLRDEYTSVRAQFWLDKSKNTTDHSIPKTNVK